jgi:class 3 adenylate cyclase
MCLSDVIDDMAVEMEAFIRRVTSDAGTTDVEPALVTAMAVCVDGRPRADVASVVERCGGTLQGPATTAIFDTPGRAVRCASTLVREVGAVGIGMHAGECFPTADGYRGAAVEIAHRLAREARPREVLLTGTVRDLVASRDLDVVHRELTASDLDLEVVALRRG